MLPVGFEAHKAQNFVGSTLDRQTRSLPALSLTVLSALLYLT